MIKIVVGGTCEKATIAKLVEEIGGEQIEVFIKSDLDATMMLKNGQAQVYIGACHTGGGGSLALPLALLGADKCLTIAMPGKTLSEEEISSAIKRGVVAFGLVPQAIKQCVPTLVSKSISHFNN